MKEVRPRAARGERLGVFLCDCGEEIASVLDMEALEAEARMLPGVATARRVRRCCSPDGLEVLRSAIAEHAVERVLVAGCTPRTLEARFRAACTESGVGEGLCQLVDIRELCAWVHSGEPQAATVKALDLLRMGVADLALRQPQAAVSVGVAPAALVIGGGVAGLTATLALAEGGLAVSLIEREPALGGLLRHAHSLYPDYLDAAEFLRERIDAVTHHPRVQVLLNHYVAAVSGSVGRYAVRVQDAGAGENGVSALEVGAIIVATGAQPQPARGLYGYDGQRVVTQLEFERELDDAASLAAVDRVVMILCAGHDQPRRSATPFAPGGAPWSLPRGKAVRPGGRRPNGGDPTGEDRPAESPFEPRAPVRRGRTARRGKTACSSLCCLGALKQAVELKALRPQASVAVLFQDLCLPENGAKAELLKAQASEVQFLQHTSDHPPVVDGETVDVLDQLSGATHRLPYDRLVLGVPLVPQADAASLAHMLHITQDDNGFFPEPRDRLRPQNTVERGIYVCGAAHYPVDWRGAEFQALGAAFRALRHVQGGVVTSHAPVAVVEEALCTGCGNCVGACAFGAIAMGRREGVLDLAQVDSLLCKGCGNCAVVCPSKAIQLPQSNEMQMLAQIDAALASSNPAAAGRSSSGDTRIVAFGCEWSGHAAAELAGARRLEYPSGVRLIRVGCSARVDPLHILWAFFNGADGVFLGACPPGDCHYINGNRYAQERLETLQGLIAARGFDPRRLRLEWVTPDDPHDFAGKITAFARLVEALGPVEH